MTGLTRGQTERRAKMLERLRQTVRTIDAPIIVGETSVPVHVALGEVIRIGSISSRSDGFPSGGGAERAGSSDSTSTESAALRGLPAAGSSARDDWSRHTPVDRRGAACKRVHEILSELDRLSLELHDAYRVVLSVQDPEKLEAETDYCEICEAVITRVGSDQPRHGICPSCYWKARTARGMAIVDRVTWDWAAYKAKTRTLRNVELQAVDA